MTSRRRKPRRDRIRKRLQVRFGIEPSLRSGGFTTNLSSSGVGVTTPTVFPAGTRLTLRLSLPLGQTCEVGGIVAWSLAGAANMGMPGQMGVRIDSRGVDYDGLLASMGLLPAADQAVSDPSSSEKDEARRQVSAIRGRSGAISPASASTRRAMRASRLPRFGARFPTRFGDAGDLALEGISVDLSSSGLALVSRFVAPAGSDIALVFQLPDGGQACLAGEVMWARVRPLVPGFPNGMGVRLNEADPTYLRFVRSLARRSILVNASLDELMASPS